VCLAVSVAAALVALGSISFGDVAQAQGAGGASGMQSVAHAEGRTTLEHRSQTEIEGSFGYAGSLITFDSELRKQAKGVRSASKGEVGIVFTRV